MPYSGRVANASDPGRQMSRRHGIGFPACVVRCHRGVVIWWLAAVVVLGGSDCFAQISFGLARRARFRTAPRL